jgi:hypothetical protein
VQPETVLIAVPDLPKNHVKIIELIAGRLLAKSKSVDRGDY